MTREDVGAFFTAVLKTYCPDVPVIRAKQDVPVPYGSCVVVDLLAERGLGDQLLYDKDAETVEAAGLREATLNIQAYGPGSIERLAGLWSYLELPSVVDRFFTANIAVNYAGDVQDLTALLDSRRYLERAGLDLTVSYDRSAKAPADWFDVVYVTGTLAAGKDSDTASGGASAYTTIEFAKEA